METFQNYGINAPNIGNGQYRTVCPQCEPERKHKGNQDLSVNLDKNTWLCHHCGWAGHLKSDIKTFPKTYTQKEDTSEKSEIKTEPPGNPIELPELLPLTEEAIKYLESRGISQATAEDCGCKSSQIYSRKLGKKINSIAFCIYNQDGKIVNVKHRAVEIKDFSQTKNGSQTELFNAQNASGETVIITEGEIDALSIFEAGFHSVVSCPNGALPVNAKDIANKLLWIDANSDIFGSAGKIILAMDKDLVGLNFERIIAEKIGVEKCFSVSYPEGCKDANEVLMKCSVEELRKAIEHPIPFPVSGITTFSEHESEIMLFKQNRGKENIFSTGFESLDKYYKLQRGSLNILTGVPSHGKSEFLDQIIANTMLDYKWRWAIFSPENYPIPIHFQKLAEKITKRPLFNPSETSAWNIPPISDDEAREAIRLLSKYIKILTVTEKTSDLDSILNRVAVCVARDKISAFVLDPWNEIEHSRPNNLNETEYISQALSRIRNFARLHNVMAWVVAHPTKLIKDKQTGKYPIPTAYDISGSANWRNKADNVLCVHRDIAANDGRIEIHVQKVKSKNVGTTGNVVPLFWTKANGVISCYRGIN